MSASVITEDPSQTNITDEEDTSEVNPDKKTWLRHIPFTRSWQESRKARSQSGKIRAAAHANVLQKSPASIPQAVPTPATEIGRAKQKPVAARTALAAEPQTRNEKSTKSLAQYGHHDGKGAVGWTATKQMEDMPYPRRQYVQGHKVLAQYGHHDNKWAVKHPVY